MANRLASESSPYLLQHKDNPVDWYPWGAEAFTAAKAQDKPIFVSIGYAACHWCHVMAHESFEDEEIAALMNELFINVKVDREERPDVDVIYMNAIHVMGEGGGWPLSAFCTAEGKPYFLGTYFPPADRYGRPGFPAVLRAMARVYREERDKVEHNVEALMEGLKHIDEHFRQGDDTAKVDHSLLVTAGRALAQRSDPEHGGLGTKPKFPSPSVHELLGRCGRLTFGKPAREAFLLQAKKMARGGIYDHLGGGFSRYSVDEKWLIPHFEKMLYDNGQLLSIYGDAHAITTGTEAAEYAQVIDETVSWLEREMLHASGGLYASQDADSEGEEGKYYVWTPEEIDAVLGPVDAIFFKKAYGVTGAGNFEHGTTVLERVMERGSASDEAALAAMRARLFAVRDQRVHPDTDTKVLAGWNGLAVSGLVRAWGATGNQRAMKLAGTVADFLASAMQGADGRLARVWKDGVTKLEGTVDDYAFVARAFLDLAEATGDAAWWQRGAALVEVILDRFYREEGGVGVFYMTPHDHPEPLIHRPESHSDGAIPSGAAVAVECLLRLGMVAGDPRAMGIAESYVRSRAGQIAGNVFGSARLLVAVDSYLNGIELVVTDGEGRDALLEAARRAYAPSLMIAGPWAAPSLREGKANAPDGHALAYVCQGQSCLEPIREAAELAELLGREPE